jgi:hypothetical protein
MMTRIGALLVLLLSFQGTFTAGGSLLADMAMPGSAQGVMLQGTVMSAGNSRLMIMPDSGEVLELLVAGTARITRDGQVAPLEDLQPKDFVSVICAGNGQDKIATDISARSPL